MKTTTLTLCFLAINFISCKDASTDANATNTAPVTVDNSKPVNIEGFKFKFRLNNEKPDEYGMPYGDIYLMAQEYPDSVLLTSDSNAMALSDVDSRHVMDIPRNVDIAISCYFAGAGNVYYGIAKENKLEVYAHFSEDPTATQNEKMLYKPFKTFAFYDNRIEEITVKK